LGEVFVLPTALGFLIVVPTAVGVSFLIGLLAFPLCGGAPTFLCRRKEK
jgi:hypothetical protein